MKIVFKSILLAVCAMLFSGCAATSPTAQFYELRSIPGAPSARGAAALPSKTIGIGPIEISEVLNRPQLVTAGNGNELHIVEYHRWGGTLLDNIGRVLATNIASRIGSEQVFPLTWNIGVDTDYRIALNVYRFDGQPGGEVRIEADWIVLDDRGKPLTPVIKASLVESTTDGGYGSLVAALDRLLARLSDQIANRLARF